MSSAFDLYNHNLKDISRSIANNNKVNDVFMLMLNSAIGRRKYIFIRAIIGNRMHKTIRAFLSPSTIGRVFLFTALSPT